MLILPVFLLILMGMLEFGAVYDHRTAMAYAVREGARVGATLGNGGSNPDTVDPTILAAVQRGLTDPILIENITSIEIYKAGSTGKPVGTSIDKYDRTGNPIGTRRLAGVESGRRPVAVTRSGSASATTSIRRRRSASCSACSSAATRRTRRFPMVDQTVMHLEPTP